MIARGAICQRSSLIAAVNGEHGLQFLKPDSGPALPLPCSEGAFRVCVWGEMNVSCLRGFRTPTLLAAEPSEQLRMHLSRFQGNGGITIA